MKKVFYLLSLFFIFAISTESMAVVDDCFGGKGGDTKPNDPDSEIMIFEPAGDPVLGTEVGTNLPL